MWLLFNFREGRFCFTKIKSYYLLLSVPWFSSSNWQKFLHVHYFKFLLFSLFFFPYWWLFIFSCVLYCYKECWMQVLHQNWYLFLLWPKVKMFRNKSEELKDIFAFNGYCQILHWYLYFLIIQWLVSFMSLVNCFFFFKDLFFFNIYSSFLKSLLNLVQHCFCFLNFGFLAMRHAGPQFPNQGLNLHPLHGKAKSQPLDL